MININNIQTITLSQSIGLHIAAWQNCIS